MPSNPTLPNSAPAPRNPWTFVPSLYFAEGLPYTLVNLVSPPLLKGLGASNETIGLTSLLYLPWTIKLLWGPVVERYSTKRRWILATQLILTILLIGLALGMLSPVPTTLALLLFVPIAFTSATHDIAVDGYYLEVLSPPQQALFVGIRSTAYKLAWLTGTGGMVYLAGKIASGGGSLAAGWALSFGLAAALFAALVWYHSRILLCSSRSVSPGQRGVRLGKEFLEAFLSYLRQPKIVPILAFILIYRLGDALMLKMAQPFLMDSAGKGGLGLGTDQVGIVYGTVGTIFSLAGGILGGWLVAKGGLRRWMWPLALIQNVFIILYWLLAIHRPGIAWVAVVNSFEQFAYGLGVSAYTVFLMRTVKAEFKSAHFAIATSFMALGIMIPGAASGYLQSALGYSNFFLLSFFLAVPGMLLLFFLPYWREDTGCR